jgi:hypothetical protein
VTTDPPVDLVRSVIAVLGGIVIGAVLPEVLETTLVRAASDAPLADLSAYFAIRNRPGMLVTKIVSSGLTGVLAGYFAAKLSGTLELGHAAIAGLVQTASLAWGFTLGEYASATPIWVRVFLVALAAPAMLLGASVRRRARLAEWPSGDTATGSAADTAVGAVGTAAGTAAGAALAAQPAPDVSGPRDTRNPPRGDTVRERP